MRVKLLLPAQAEFEEAVAFYNEQRDGLGSEFTEEVRKAMQRVVLHPQAWARLSRRTRRCRTNRFPYGLIYQVRDDLILIVAVAHLSRKPDYWRDRLKLLG